MSAETSPSTGSHHEAAPDVRDAEVDALVDALLTASRVLVGVSARSLVDLDDSVTLPQFRTLVVLDAHGALNLNRLAERLEVNNSSAVRMIDRLLAAGLVTRRENPDNRREVILGLTAEGEATVRRVTSRRRRDIDRIVARMPSGERSELIAALRAFSEAADEPSTDGRNGSASAGGPGSVSALGW